MPLSSVPPTLMNQNQEDKVVALRREVLSNLKLQNADVTEELVETFRKFLEKTDNTRNVVKTLKPKKRISISLDFINDRHPKSRTNKSYFWPVAIGQLSESQILEQLSDLMFLEAGKIPGFRTGPGLPSTPAIQTRPVEPQDIPQHASQSSLQEPELLAKKANDRNEEKDPDYTEPASDYVLDTSRETRRVSKNLSTSPSKQLPSPMGMGSGRLKPTGPPAGRATQSHSSILNAPKVSHARSSSSGQICTPPLSAKKLGKRPATSDPYDMDAEMFAPDSSLQTGMYRDDPSPAGPSRTWSTLETDLHPVSSHYAGPSRKRVRYEDPAQVAGLSESITAARIPSPPVLATSSSAQPLQQALDLSVDNIRRFDQGTEGLVSATRADSAPAPVSPSRMNFDSFYPPSPKPTADAAVECQREVASGDRIVIDFQGLQYAQLYDLPSIFLDQLAECRRSHEMNGTNESRARAAVLRDVEQHLRTTLKGP